MTRAKKKSAKGSNFKEHDRALPFLKLFLDGPRKTIKTLLWIISFTCAFLYVAGACLGGEPKNIY